MSATDPLDLVVHPFQTSGPDQLAGRVVALQAGREVARVLFRIPASQGPFATITPRTAALTFLLPAMRLRVPLRVDGAMDPLTIAQLQAWQEITAAWSGSRLTPVPIEATGWGHANRRVDGPLSVLMAFSGGVDSCHSFWRHRRAARGPAVVHAGLMVHGFDVPLNRQAEFDGAMARTRTILESHGAQAWQVATDIRRLERTFGFDWEEEAHGVFLAACLSTHERDIDALMIASTYPARSLRMPWGSNPVTDPLLGGPHPLLHDGTAFSKWEKVAAFAHDPVLQRHIRVCWEGDRLDRNCGRCFKCLTTFVSFQLAGVEDPSAFPADVSRSRLRTLRVANRQNRELVQAMMREARVQGRVTLAADLAVALRRSARTPAWWMRAARAGRRSWAAVRRSWRTNG
jgi:hypothetical protein